MAANETLTVIDNRCGACYEPPMQDGTIRALDVLFILHVDHESNCSTNAMRLLGSAQTDPY